MNILGFDETIPESMLQPMGVPSMTDAERLERTSHLRIPAESSRIAEIMELSKHVCKLEYLGFCPWQLVATDGGLIPGNPNMRVAKLGAKFFALSSLDAARTFGKAPKKYF